MFNYFQPHPEGRSRFVEAEALELSGAKPLKTTASLISSG
jgi:hypothetical protein